MIIRYAIMYLRPLILVFATQILKMCKMVQCEFWQWFQMRIGISLVVRLTILK